MQTFLPYPDFARSASVLDRQRLGKQRSEVKQILDSLEGKGGWVNHPAVKMWVGFEEALIRYGMAVCHEWQKRGYRDELYDEFWCRSDCPLKEDVPMPPWLGDERLHSSHRSNLLRKDEHYYRRFGWTEPPTLSYFWPSEWY